MQNELYDVIVIGAGVSGCACAREIMRHEGRVLVIEAEDDVCCGTSKANSAIVHAGFDARPGTLMARLNVEGNRLFDGLSQDLDVAFVRIGSLVVCTSEKDRPGLAALLERGRANGVEGLRIVEQDELRQMEPHVSEDAICALWAPTAGICDSFGLTIALAENAAANGCEFAFDTRVTSVEREGGLWRVVAGGSSWLARVVVNAAGVYADEIHNMVAPPNDRLCIAPRRGEYMLLDTTAGNYVAHTVFMLPTAMGKGVLVTPTLCGNLLVGPTADDTDDKEGVQTTDEGLRSIAQKCALTVKDVPLGEVITSFSGLRAHLPQHEFQIGEVAGAPGFVDCAGIESPGLTASPAIGRMVAEIVQGILHARPREGWIAKRRGFVNLNMIDEDGWNELIARDQDYGKIVCRCCRVSEAQVRDACRRTPGARSVDGVKRRTGATMGRCQGGFCSPRVMQIISEETEGLSPDGVTKCGAGSACIMGHNKDVWEAK